MGFDKRLVLPIVLVAIGVAVVVTGAYLALKEFISYEPVSFMLGSIEQSISTTISAVVNLVIRIALIATAIWGGSLLLRYGTRSYVDFNKPPKIVKVYVKSRKRSS